MSTLEEKVRETPEDCAKRWANCESGDLTPFAAASAIRDFSRQVASEERERCCRAICSGCRVGKPEATPEGYTHRRMRTANSEELIGCRAAAIRSLGDE